MITASTPGETLFSSNTDGKPHVQDVLQCKRAIWCRNAADPSDVKVENHNYFDRAFSLVIFALAHNPARIQSLFKPLQGDEDDGKYEFTFYEPVNHGYQSVPVSFNEVTDFQGGKDLTNLTDRW